MLYSKGREKARNIARACSKVGGQFQNIKDKIIHWKTKRRSQHSFLRQERSFHRDTETKTKQHGSMPLAELSDGHRGYKRLTTAQIDILKEKVLLLVSSHQGTIHPTALIQNIHQIIEASGVHKTDESTFQAHVFSHS